jgi:hypothetical protein
VEGTHGQLRARLTDRLRGDDADSFTDVDRRAARKVTAVAGSADAGLDFAGQRRTDLDRLDACGLDIDTWASSIIEPALTITIAGDRMIDVVKRVRPRIR